MADNQLSAHRDINADLVPRYIGDRVFLCNNAQRIMLAKMLDGGENKIQISGTAESCKIEWMETYESSSTDNAVGDWPVPPSTGVDCFGNATYPVETIAVEHPQYFTLYSVWSVDPPPSDYCPPGQTTTAADDAAGGREYIFIKGRDCDAGTIDVVRGWHGTAVLDILDGTCLRREFNVAPECPEQDNAPLVANSVNHNYFQIMSEGYSETKKHQFMKHYGIANQTEEHRSRLMGGTIGGRMVDGLLPTMLENAIFRGIRHPGGGSGAGASFGGIDSFNIPQYTISGGAMDYFTLAEIMHNIYECGGDFNENNYLFIMSPRLKMMMSQWAECLNCNREATSNQWGVKVDSFMSDFGTLDFTMHRGLRNNEMYILDTSKMGLINGWDWEEERVATGTSICYPFQITAMKSFFLACACHHAKIVCCPSCYGDGCKQCCVPEVKEVEYCEPGVPVGDPLEPRPPGPTPAEDCTAEERLAMAKTAAKKASTAKKK